MSRTGNPLSLLARRDPRRIASDLLLASGERVRLGAVTRAGRLVKREPGVEFRHGLRTLQAYSVILLISGTGRFRDAHGYSSRVTAGDLIWVFPGVGHSYGPEAGDRWEEIYLVFLGNMFDLWRETGLIDPARPVWRAEPVSRWQRRLAAVIPANHPINELAALAAAGRLQAVIADLATQQETRSVGAAIVPAWLDAARRRLEAGETPALVARDLNLGYDSFRKRFAAASGLAPARFQMLCRIEQACALLRDDTLPIKVIAERTGFADEFHFSKRFRQIVGQPPSRFRNYAC
jgi:AraC-like DNA-binding protein